MLPLPTIQAFDAWLAERELGFEAIVIGGSALALLGVTRRTTRDLDVLHPIMPEPIARASREFATERRKEGDDLADDWLNNGPTQLGEVLPAGWQRRVQVIFTGTALTLETLGRSDLLKSKLFALCDRGTDLADCVALSPSDQELTDAEPWLAEQDANPMWPDHVRATLDDLRRRLDRDV